MIPAAADMAAFITGIPRESGDDPYAALRTPLEKAYSPRERG